MPTTMPTVLDTFQTKLNKPGVSETSDNTEVWASDFNRLQDGLLAVEKLGLGPWAYNVKGYGAKGDGTTDDTAAIAAALSAASAAGGGLVYFPAGTYLSGPQTLVVGVYLRGAGMEVSVLKLKNGANADLLQGQSFGTLTGTTSAAGINNWGIADLTLDGNKANQSGTSWPLRIFGYGFVLHNLIVHDGLSGGVWSEWGNSSVAGPTTDSMEAFVKGVKTHGCGGHGLVWAGPHDSYLSDIVSYQNGAGSDGIHIQTNGSSSHFHHCHAWGTNHAKAFYIGAAGCRFSDTDAEGGTAVQVHIDAADCTMAGLTVHNPGNAAANGVQVGTVAGAAPSGLSLVGVEVVNLTAPAFNFANDGGFNRVTASIYSGGAGGTVLTGTVNAGTQYDFSIANITSDGTVNKGGGVRFARSSNFALQAADAAGTNVFRVDTINKLVKMVNGTGFAVYSNDGTTIVGSVDGGGNAFFNTYHGSLTNAGNIGNSFSFSPLTDALYTAVTGNVTGFAIQSGFFDGQELTVYNSSAFTITPAVQATSKILGAGVIVANSARSYKWSATAGLWFPCI